MYSGLFNLAYNIDKTHIKEQMPNKKTNNQILEHLAIKKNEKSN